MTFTNLYQASINFNYLVKVISNNNKITLPNLDTNLYLVDTKLFILGKLWPFWLTNDYNVTLNFHWKFYKMTLISI